MRGKRNTEIEFNMTLGKLMERRRRAEGFSREQLLRLMDEPRSTSLLCGYETGSKPVALPFMLRWCEVMGIGLNTFLEAVSNEMNRQPSNATTVAGTKAGSTEGQESLSQHGSAGRRRDA